MMGMGGMNMMGGMMGMNGMMMGGMGMGGMMVACPRFMYQAL
jgi:hypothetical protein